MENRNIVIANTPFNPRFTQGERRRGVRYIVATYGNVKAREMSPKDFGTYQAGKKCHNYKNRRK